MTYQYKINPEKLTDAIMLEISKIAATTTGENGIRLYDTILPTSSDTPTIISAIQSSVTAIQIRFSDVSVYKGDTLAFYLPDMPSGNETKATEELTKYIVENVTADWMLRRYPSKAKEYSDRAEVTLKKAAAILKTRKTPHR